MLLALMKSRVKLKHVHMQMMIQSDERPTSIYTSIYIYIYISHIFTNLIDVGLLVTLISFALSLYLDSLEVLDTCLFLCACVSLALV